MCVEKIPEILRLGRHAADGNELVPFFYLQTVFLSSKKFTDERMLSSYVKDFDTAKCNIKVLVVLVK